MLIRVTKPSYPNTEQLNSDWLNRGLIARFLFIDQILDSSLKPVDKPVLQYLGLVVMQSHWLAVYFYG